MTLDKAMRRSWQWFTAAVATLVLRLSLDAMGVDLFSLPLEGLSTICLMISSQRAGWARGYRDRSEEDA